MSIFHKLNRSLGMEDDAPNVQVNIDTDEGGMPLDDVVATDDGEFEPTPEADAAEIEESSVEIDTDNTDIENLERATESLIALYTGMESAQLNGGLSQEAAMFAAISVESIMGKYDVTAKDMGISLESFESNKSHATTVSMEGIGQALKDIWTAIVNKFKEMVKKIVDFYQKTIAAAPRIKRRAEGIKKKAEKTAGSPKESKIKTGLFASLNIQGLIPTADNIEGALEKVRITFKANLTKDEISNKIKEAFSVEKWKGGKAGDHIYETLHSINFTGSTKPPADFKFQEGSYLGPLPGNRAIFVGNTGTAIKGSEGYTDAVNNWEYGVFEDKPGVKNDKENRDKEFPVLGTSDIVKICDNVIRNMDDIILFKTQANREIKAADLVEKEGKKLVELIIKEDASKEAGARRYLSAMGSAHRKAQAGNAAIVRYNYSLSKSALAYCARSLSQYRD